MTSILAGPNQGRIGRTFYEWWTKKAKKAKMRCSTAL